MIRILYIIYEICIALPIILVATILTALTTTVGGVLGNQDFWGYYPGMIWSRIICMVLFLPVKVKGKENITNGKAYIIVANHQSIFDVFMIYGYLGIKFKWLMKKELAQIPLVGTACTKAGFIYIDRSSKMKSHASMTKASEILRRGMSMAIFPEGTRTGDGQIGKFKKGAFLLAQDLQIPILPVTINGTFQVMSRHAVLPSWHRTGITIHTPIEPPKSEGLTEAETNAMIRQISTDVAEIIGSALERD